MKDMKKTAALLAAMALLGVGSASAAEAAPMYALKGITVGLISIVKGFIVASEYEHYKTKLFKENNR